MNKFGQMTAEQRAEALAKAQIARQAKKAEREENKKHLKMDYLDMNSWMALASKYKIRMPLEGVPVSVSVIRKYLKKAEVPVEVWNLSYTSMKYFVENNSKWTAQAVVGLILELKNETNLCNDLLPK